MKKHNLNFFQQLYASLFQRKMAVPEPEEDRLKDLRTAEELMDFIGRQKMEDWNSDAYFKLVALAEASGDKKVVQFLIDQADRAQDWPEYYGILIGLNKLKKPPGINLKPILNAIRGRKILIKKAAIDALRNTTDKTAEEALLGILKSEKNKDLLIAAMSALSMNGSRAAIPAIQSMTENPKRAIAEGALWCLVDDFGAEFLDLYRSNLEKGQAKTPALMGVCKFGDKSDIPIIRKRIKELVTTKSSVTFHSDEDKTEIMMGMEFLKNIESKEDYRQLLAWLVEERAEKMSQFELSWLRKELSELKA